MNVVLLACEDAITWPDAVALVALFALMGLFLWVVSR